MWTADEVAKLCYERFRSLPRRGKPEAGREWSLLAAVLRVSRCSNTRQVVKEVVSMGTGTKCIGQTAMSPNGDVLNDSHAEVIARRGCVRYLIQELHRAVSGGDSSVFRRADEQGKWRLKPGVSFLFFTSHTPCGDASIIPRTACQSQPCSPVRPVESQEGTNKGTDGGGGGLKRKAEKPGEERRTKVLHLEEEETKPESKESRKHTETSSSLPARNEDCFLSDVTGSHVENVSQTSRVNRTNGPQVPDIHRTGAKCVPGGPADPLDPGSGYHSTGLLRIKPGRGEPTLSLSCSDKLARWGVLGFQGALLSHYLQEALCFSAVVVGRCPYSPEAMQRALVTRCSHVSDLPPGFSISPPVILQSSLEFPFSQAQTELRHQVAQGRVAPCGAAISWCNVTEQPLDVTANGYKHGVTKKVLGTTKSRSRLCKVELFHAFLSLVSATDPSELPASLSENVTRRRQQDALCAASCCQVYTGHSGGAAGNSLLPETTFNPFTPVASKAHSREHAATRKDLNTYWDYKQASLSYQQAWQQLRLQAFPLWPRASRDLLLFH